MKIFFKKYREIFAIASYLLLIVALVYVVIFPLIKKIETGKDRIQEEKIIQEINIKNIEDLPEKQNQYQILEKAGLEDVLQDKDSAVDLIEKLEKLAADTNNQISIIAQDQSGTNQKNQVSSKNNKKTQEISIVSELPIENYLQFRITLTGDYFSIRKFIGVLENFDYQGDLIGIQIKKAQKNDNIKVKSDPFSKDNQVEQQSVEGKLESVLDVVFYNK